jgi:hypothetical protein
MGENKLDSGENKLDLQENKVDTPQIKDVFRRDELICGKSTLSGKKSTLFLERQA